MEIGTLYFELFVRTQNRQLETNISISSAVGYGLLSQHIPSSDSRDSGFDSRLANTLYAIIRTGIIRPEGLGNGMSKNI
jgi:hypothetical protein